MNLVVKDYQEGKYQQCLTRLSTLTTDSLIEEFSVQNNVLACKFQKSYIDGSLRKLVLDEFLQLWSKILTLPHGEEYNLLTICCACNVIYTLMTCAEYNEIGSIKATQIVCETLDKLSCNYQVFFYQEKNSQYEKQQFLTSQLLQSRKLKENEVSLLLYLLVLKCLIQTDDKCVQSVVDLLESVESKPNKLESNIFLLSPTILQQSNSTICDLSKVFLSIFHCNNNSFNEALSVMTSTTTSQLYQVGKIVKMYAALHNDCHEPFDSSSEDGELTGILKFVSYLINAAKFAMKGKPFMALKLLNCATAEELAQTQICSIIMIFSATQFKALEQPKFEVEALKIAEESLLKSPPFSCSIHSELDGFLVSQLKLFRIPEISVVRYQLARAFLRNQQYQEAIVEYEKLSADSFQQFENSFPAAFKLCSPSNSVVLHERVLALILGNNGQKALDIIDSSLEEDYLLSFLHAEACVQLKQFKKAIQLINRSIVKLSSTTFAVNGTTDVIKSKFHFRLAQLFDETGNTKDAFHQMKISVRFGKMDRKMDEFFQKFSQKLGVEKELPTEFDSNLEEIIVKIMKVSDDLALHYVLTTR